MPTQARALTWDYICELETQRDALITALQSFCVWAEAHRTAKGSPARSHPYRLARIAISKAARP